MINKQVVEMKAALEAPKVRESVKDKATCKLNAV
jgi:hypothetical protein